MQSIKELQNFTFVSKYARWLPEEKRRETWKEAVNRVKNMMLNKYAKDYPTVVDDIHWAYDFLEKKKVLGSQRVLQFAGDPIQKKNLRSFNCLGTHCDRLKVFQECMFSLLCGCGIGVSVQKQHVIQLPTFSSKTFQFQHDKPAKIYQVPDTIEGWADAVGVLFSTYMKSATFPEWSDYRVQYDFSKIRPKGSYLSSSSGNAPGPDGLENSLKMIEGVLATCLQNGQRRLKPINVYDIICHTSDAVLSGAVRRSAILILISKDDIEMIEAKTGNWMNTNPQRARSNNTVALLRNNTTFEEFEAIVKRTREFGEPGFYFSDDLDIIPNPCNEAGLYPIDITTGKTGFEGCNLCTINTSNIKDVDDFYDRCKAAAIMGTLQAGFTSFPYLGEVTEKIFRREALLGVSMLGMMEKPEITLNEDIQKHGAELIKKTNEIIAKKININVAARTTLLKPDGNSGCLLGTSSGIHPHHAKRYIRHVQVNKEEKPYHLFKEVNPIAVEESVWSSNNTDDVIKFPIEVPDGSKLKNQMPALTFLKVVKNTQQNWVRTGQNKKYCVKPYIHHNVSNTIRVQENEWDEVVHYIFDNKEFFGGVSLLAESGDKDYPQAPFVEVLMSHEIVSKYGDGAIWCSGLIELALQIFGNGVSSSASLWTACLMLLDDDFEAEASKLIPKTHRGRISDDVKRIGMKCEFWERGRNFANKYFNGDLKKLTYCLKDVYIWKSYYDLKKTFKSVDYTQAFEQQDNTRFEAESACGGDGSCEVMRV